MNDMRLQFLLMAQFSIGVVDNSESKSLFFCGDLFDDILKIIVVEISVTYYFCGGLFFDLFVQDIR